MRDEGVRGARMSEQADVEPREGECCDGNDNSAHRSALHAVAVEKNSCVESGEKGIVERARGRERECVWTC